jgi:hypothetical protein
MLSTQVMWSYSLEKFKHFVNYPKKKKKKLIQEYDARQSANETWLADSKHMEKGLQKNR